MPTWFRIWSPPHVAQYGQSLLRRAGHRPLPRRHSGMANRPLIESKGGIVSEGAVRGGNARQGLKEPAVIQGKGRGRGD